MWLELLAREVNRLPFLGQKKWKAFVCWEDRFTMRGCNGAPSNSTIKSMGAVRSRIWLAPPKEPCENGWIATTGSMGILVAMGAKKKVHRRGALENREKAAVVRGLSGVSPLSDTLEAARLPSSGCYYARRIRRRPGPVPSYAPTWGDLSACVAHWNTRRGRLN